MIYLKKYIKLWSPINYIPFFLGVHLLFGQDGISGSEKDSQVNNVNEFVSINEVENRFLLSLRMQKVFFLRQLLLITMEILLRFYIY